ncbi:hypothetical protein F5Y04DRAFT_275461 [Hypomontagnella monticulosa]|nr:hypothetical protein F5Y04DRAFT_275461 [Hypomontagnella monticulosa]
MAEVGVIPPPEGVTPDFYSWTSLQTSLMTVFVITFVFATGFLALRLYTAFAIVKKLDWDIFFIVAAWGTSLAFFVGMIIAMPAGFGRHLWDVTPTQLLGYYNVLLLLAITYIWPPTLTKLAMLVLYLRINPSRPFHICVYIVGLLIIAYTVVFTVLFAAPCNPLSVGSGVCLNNIAISQAVLNILSDVALIILPIPMIYRLNMPLRQKIIIGILMGLGSAVIIASIARVAYVRAMIGNPDVTWTQASAAVLSSVELNIGIVCNSMARLKPFVRVHFPSWMRSFGSSGRLEDSDKSKSKSNNGPRSWRGDKASHSYKLGSIEHGEGFPAGAQGNNKDIYITNNFQVDYDARVATPARTGSTESILAPERDSGRVV